jgi:hypothetical protein
MSVCAVCVGGGEGVFMVQQSVHGHLPPLLCWCNRGRLGNPRE